LATTVFLTTSPAHADNHFLKRAQRAYERLDYERILPLLDRAERIATEEAERADIHRLRGIVHAVYGRTNEAVASFVELLRLRPDFIFPRHESPKVVEALAAAREQLAAERVAAESPAPPGPVSPPPPEVRVVERATPWVRWTGVVAGAVGVAALGVGAYFGASSSSTWDESLDTGISQRRAFNLSEDARSQARVANILFIAGGSLALVGGGLFAFDFFSSTGEESQ
jgi:hypothetical protein